jgi:acyl-CoA thioester hydrolase
MVVPTAHQDGAAAVATGPQRQVYQAQVRWSDPDQLGHINHARYLSYFEDARMDLLAGSPSGLAGSTGDHGYIAARVAVDYLYPVRYRAGLTLRVETWVSRLGRTSWTLRAELYDGDHLVARCEAVLVAYSYEHNAKRPLDDDERSFWQARLAGTDQ